MAQMPRVSEDNIVDDMQDPFKVIQTYSEQLINVFNPDPSAINIVDIAHATSMNCRFNGHILEFYSVAQHCVHTADILYEETGDPELALWGLLHDASEAYIADLASPIKRAMPNYKSVEELLTRTIVSVFGLFYIEPPEVKAVDTRMLVTEARDLMPESWMLNHGHNIGAEPYQHIKLEGWSPRKANIEYLNAFAKYSQLMRKVHENTTV